MRLTLRGGWRNLLRGLGDADRSTVMGMTPTSAEWREAAPHAATLAEAARYLANQPTASAEDKARLLAEAAIIDKADDYALVAAAVAERPVPVPTPTPTPAPTAYPVATTMAEAMGLFAPGADRYPTADAIAKRKVRAVKFVGQETDAATAQAKGLELLNGWGQGTNKRYLIISMPVCLAAGRLANDGRNPDGSAWNYRVTLKQAAEGALDGVYAAMGRRAVELHGADVWKWVAIRPGWEPAWFMPHGTEVKVRQDGQWIVRQSPERVGYFRLAVKRQKAAFCAALVAKGYKLPAWHASPAINSGASVDYFWVWPEGTMTHYSPDLYHRFNMVGQSQAQVRDHLLKFARWAKAKGLIFGMDETGVAIGGDSGGDNGWWWSALRDVFNHPDAKGNVSHFGVFAEKQAHSGINFDVFDAAAFPKANANLRAVFGAV